MNTEKTNASESTIIDCEFSSNDKSEIQKEFLKFLKHRKLRLKLPIRTDEDVIEINAKCANYDMV